MTALSHYTPGSAGTPADRYKVDSFRRPEPPAIPHPRPATDPMVNEEKAKR